MPYEKIVKFINLLEQRTTNGEVEWQETADEGMFQAAFPGYSVRVFPRTDEDGDTDYVVQIYNETGSLIEEVRVIDIRESPSREAYLKAAGQMRSLYEGARRRAMGVDQALDQIIGNLEEERPF